MATSTCRGCGLALAATGGPAHRYIPSSPECWAVYGEVLAREYSDPAIFAGAHELSVDTYAVQHAAGDPASSLTTHLVGLHLSLERGMAHDRIAPLRVRFSWEHEHAAIAAIAAELTW
ncbi:MAG: DUF5946 family protein [Egibacteraceae bacterium]